ncbi:uncharacterized protein AKAW2_50122S [Aspergillus luchuensis]|uniref:C2H2-type domain-containing protein n=1 Tax=Aspergillus kawachii TaxID=1069201 RepID=A0A7R7WBK2_ASPKA|nr:uncharacterized protein AKAW2_50122S [Aspergillus luchuensis]BCR99779.1 hypothetical protein AKAW2_50122S [Aspergillus luchuensis]
MLTSRQKEIRINDLLNSAPAKVPDGDNFCDDTWPPSGFPGNIPRHSATTYENQRESGGVRKRITKAYGCPMIGCSGVYPTYAKLMNHFRKVHLTGATEGGQSRPKVQNYHHRNPDNQPAATNSCKSQRTAL